MMSSGSCASLPNIAIYGVVPVDLHTEVLIASNTDGRWSSQSPSRWAIALSIDLMSLWDRSTGFDLGLYAGVAVLVMPSVWHSSLKRSLSNCLPLSLCIWDGSLKVTYSRNYVKH